MSVTSVLNEIPARPSRLEMRQIRERGEIGLFSPEIDNLLRTSGINFAVGALAGLVVSQAATGRGKAWKSALIGGGVTLAAYLIFHYTGYKEYAY